MTITGRVGRGRWQAFTHGPVWASQGVFMITYHDGREFDLDFSKEKHSYFLDGEKIHSVTRVIDACFPKYLVDWAVKEGAEAYLNAWNQGEVQDRYDLIINAHKEISTEAADIGSAVHDWIEEYIKGNDPAEPLVGENCISAFRDWHKKTDVTWLHSELKVLYKTDNYCFAGTVDAVAEINGRLYVIDFKTSKAIYKSYYLQVAAYVMAVKKQLGLDCEGIILRLDKETGKYQEKIFKASDHFRMFMNCLDLKNWNSVRIKGLKYEPRPTVTEAMELQRT